MIMLEPFTDTRSRVTKIINNISELAIIRDFLMTYPEQKFEEMRKNFGLYLTRFIIENIAHNHRNLVYNYRIK